MSFVKAFMVTCLVLISLMSSAMGHGRLMDPPSRGSMWRMGFKTPKNYNDNQLYCGGFTYQWTKMKGKCGVCGDPYMGRKLHEAGGKYATGTIAKTYKMGQIIEAKVDITANHKGYFQFKICPNNNPKKRVTQECLDRYPLMAMDVGNYMYQLPSTRNKMYKVKLQLPQGLVCTQCVLQWVYTSGNNWGICEDGKGRTGCGPQEQFRGCADVAIVAEGSESHPTVVKYEQSGLAPKPFGASEPVGHTYPVKQYPAKPYRPYKPISQKPIYPVKTYYPKRPTEPQYPTESHQHHGPSSVNEYEQGHPTEPHQHHGPSSADKYGPKRPTAFTQSQKPKHKYQPYYNNQGLSPKKQPYPTQKPFKPTHPKKVYRPKIVGQSTNIRHQHRPTNKNVNQGDRHGQNTIGTNSSGNKICKAVGVWMTVPGMDKWCQMNCVRGYCPPSHCKC